MNRDEPQMHTSGRQYDRRRRALGGAQSLSAAGPATETGDHPLAGRRPGGTSAAVGNCCPAGLLSLIHILCFLSVEDIFLTSLSALNIVFCQIIVKV